MDKEIWKDIEGYEGRYQVSDRGKIRGLVNTRGNLLDKPRLLKLSIDRKGYIFIHLKMEGRSKYAKVHRIVAQAFIPNPENKPQVNHIDGNKQNNCVENLEWATDSENMRHAFDNGLNKPHYGENAYNALLTNEQVNSIRKEYIFRDKEFGCKALAQKYNVGVAVIKNVVRNRTYKENNYSLPQTSKITNEEAKAIREEYALLGEKFNAVAKAREYKVTSASIWAIVYNKSHKDLSYIPPIPRERKLQKEQIKFIRKSYLPYDNVYGAAALARKYSVSPNLIRDIIKRKKYRDIE